MRFRFDFERLFGKATDAFFAMGLTGPTAFHGAIRPVLNGHAGGDVCKAQALATEGLHKHLHVVRNNSERFLEAYDERTSYDPIKILLAGKRVVPVGTASGIDPDAEALVPLSYLFGFLMPGPVCKEPRPLEAASFVDDSGADDLYLPPVLASKGLAHFRERLTEYRKGGGSAVVLPAVVGLPSTSGDMGAAEAELEELLGSLEHLADGFVWCPFVAGAPGLLSPERFARAAELMARAAAGKLKLVEMFARPEEEMESWLDLVDAFLGGGGDGIVAVTGLVVPRDVVPGEWPYETAILAGRSLAPHRQRAIEAARRRFPKSFIAACGGFHDRDEAFTACEHANVIAENEAFTRYGPGMAPVLLQKLVLRLNHLERKGLLDTNHLVAFQERRWAALG